MVQSRLKMISISSIASSQFQPCVPLVTRQSPYTPAWQDNAAMAEEVILNKVGTKTEKSPLHGCDWKCKCWVVGAWPGNPHTGLSSVLAACPVWRPQQVAVDHHQANFVQFPSRRPGAQTNDGTLVHGGRQPGISREQANRVLTKQIIKSVWLRFRNS